MKLNATDHPAGTRVLFAGGVTAHMYSATVVEWAPSTLRVRLAHDATGITSWEPAAALDLVEVLPSRVKQRSAEDVLSNAPRLQDGWHIVSRTFTDDTPEGTSHVTAARSLDGYGEVAEWCRGPDGFWFLSAWGSTADHSGHEEDDGEDPLPDAPPFAADAVRG